jgi:2-polyprenyl-6-hydroxyphenyl methylase / 3-demethylubiquinone-9 3-methyltransferase
MSKPNVDQQEVAKFDAQANTWWDENGELRTLHHINPTRLAFITERCDLTGKNVLDVGCGGGILTESLAKAGAKTTGLDMSHEALTVARAHAQKSQLEITYVEQALESFAQAHAGEYDVITCMEMLEHVPDPSSIIAAISSLLKPGGEIFLSTLNRTWQCYFQAILVAEYVLRLIPLRTHDYDKLIKPSELDQWLQTNSCTLQSLNGLAYNPLTKTAKLTRNVDVNYIVHARKD